METTGALPQPRQPVSFRRRLPGLVSLVVTVVGLTVALALSGLLVVMPRLTGLDNLIIATGSMRPAFEPGDVALVDKSVMPADVRVGDIITYFDPQGTVVTHRVMALERAPDGGPAFQTRGDANPVEDRYVVPGEDLLGRVEHRVPYLGWVIDAIKRQEVVYAALFIPAGIIVLNELANLVRPLLARRRRQDEPLAATEAELQDPR
jgi:signal peptidase